MILDYLLISFCSLYALWFFYLAVMNLKRAKDAGTISKTALYMGYPLLFVGLLIDLFVNVAVFTVLLAELPQELTVTRRLSRHITDDTGWRTSIALWFCCTLLDTFDPSGKHCKG